MKEASEISEITMVTPVIIPARMATKVTMSFERGQ
jgi:hypothetical protein